MSSVEGPHIECDCRIVAVDQKLQTAFLYASFAFWCTFVTRPFRPGPSWLSRSTWIILAFIDTFILLTWEPETGNDRLTTQMIGVGILFAISSFITFLVELINEGDRQREANIAKKREAKEAKEKESPSSRAEGQ